MCVLLILGSVLIEASNTVVRYPRPETDFDKRSLYPTKLLQLALDRVDKDYRLVASPLIMNQGRALIQLRKGVNVDVVWSMTSRERESNLRPIRIPIHKGLIGWRLFLINVRDRYNLERKLTLDLLQKYKFVQGHDWPDTDILRANGFDVFGTPDYKRIFDMLARSRVDFFPRSIIEIWDEAKEHKKQGIVVDKKKLLIYPAAAYYFVSPQNVALAIDIEKGLSLLIKEGTFDALFNEYYNDIIKKAELGARQIYRLNNPLLPIETPIENRKLWFSIE